MLQMLSCARRAIEFGVFALLMACSSPPGSDEFSNPAGGEVEASGAFGPAPARAVPEGEVAQYVERGRYLVEKVAVCAQCHGSETAGAERVLSGGRVFTDRHGRVRAANLTSDEETGIGKWTLGELVRAIRASIDRRGRALSVEAHLGYRWMSDRDALGIAAYLKSLPAVSSSVERRELGALERRKWGLFSEHNDVQGYVPALGAGEGVTRGRYLVKHVAVCGRCHSPDYAAELSDREGPLEDAPLSGVSRGKRSLFGRLFGALSGRGEEQSDAPDIRGSSEDGLLDWSLADIEAYLLSGRRPGAETTARRCPWEAYSGMTERDRHAVAEYLKSL